MTHPLDLDIVERLRLEEEFFAQPFLMSYSGLNKLVYSPGAFYQHYVLKQKEDVTDKAAAEGKVLHCKLLNPEVFDQEFIVLPDSFPSDNPKKVIDKFYYELKSASVFTGFIPSGDLLADESNLNRILDILKEENLYQTLKTDSQRLDKILTEKNISYLQFLIMSGTRTIVEPTMVTFAERAKDALLRDARIPSIMGMGDFKGSKVQVFNELPLIAFPEKYSFGLKGIIDNLVIDHDQKVIRINDLKKTSKALNSFKDSIEYYNYWIQAAMYYKLVEATSNTAFSVDYPIEFRFIVVDPYMHMGIIKISDTTMNQWLDQTADLLKVAKYHFDHKDFSLPHNFLMSETREYVL